MRFLSSRSLMPALLLAAMPMSAMAQLSDHHGSEMQSFGLGQSFPVAANVSHDPDWLVYGFERDGVSYYQVNDVAGHVHLIVAHVDAIFWALPAGVAPLRVSLPSREILIPEDAKSTTIYIHPEFFIVRHTVGGEAVWSVQPSNGPG